MNLHPVTLAIASCSILLAASTGAPAKSDTPAPKAAAKLAKALAGRTPGSPVGCITNSRGTDMTVIDDRTILFKEGGTVYLQRPQGSCDGLERGQRTLEFLVGDAAPLRAGVGGIADDRMPEVLHCARGSDACGRCGGGSGAGTRNGDAPRPRSR